MTKHEPIGSTEIWVGNTKRDGHSLARLANGGMKTGRLGTVAYDIDGNRLGSEWAPLIIGRSEAALYDDIMMRATFGPHWRGNR